jgi:hypothetical protein
VNPILESWFSLRWKPLVWFWIQLFSDVRTVDSHYKNQLDNWVPLCELLNTNLNNCCEDTWFGVLNLEGSRSSSCDLVEPSKEWDCKKLIMEFYLWKYSKFNNLSITCLNQCCENTWIEVLNLRGQSQNVNLIFLKILTSSLNSIYSPIVLNSFQIKNLYNVEPPIIQHVPIIEHISIFSSFLNQIEWFVCHWTCKLEGYKCSWNVICKRETHKTLKKDD